MKIKSVSQFIKHLKSHSYIDGNYAFRGHSSTNYELNPLINRNENLRKERDFIELPQLQFPEVFNSSLSPINLLALLQHYGFPTRLFDVTLNPLVALYFSVCSSRNKELDGEIIVFHQSFSGLLNEEINAFSQLYKYKYYKGDYSVEEFLKDCGITERISPNMHSSNYARIKNEIRLPFFVNASYMTARQRAQSGCYIFFPNTFENDRFLPTITPIKKEKGELVETIILIDRDAKEEIKNELNNLGFNRLTLFPEDFDGSCAKLREDIEKRK